MVQGKKLIVLFPGGNHSVDMPLLYYADFTYAVRGYEKLAISYGDYIKNVKHNPEEEKAKLKENVLEQVRRINLKDYIDIVFVSKSMGTVVAGWLEDALGIKVRHISLTPTEGTLQYITAGRDISIVIAGTCDKLIDAATLKKHCEKENIPLHQVEGVGHSLEVFGDMTINIEILKEVVLLY